MTHDQDDARATASEIRIVFSRLRRRFREVSQLDDLTPTQTAVLSRLSNGEMSSSDLAGTERVRPQSMAATVGVPLERGFVDRHPDPSDGRRQVLSLSAAGRELIDGTRRDREEWLAQAVAERFTDGERATVRAALPLLASLAE